MGLWKVIIIYYKIGVCKIIGSLKTVWSLRLAPETNLLFLMFTVLNVFIKLKMFQQWRFLTEIHHKCIYQTSLQLAGCDKLDFFFLKQSKASLNSTFPFFWTGCLNKVKEPRLLYYLHITVERIDGLMPFPNSIITKWNAISFVKDMNLSHQIQFLQW